MRSVHVSCANAEEFVTIIFRCWQSFICFWLPGRMGAHQCEGELSRGSSCPPPSTCWTPATSDTGERDRRGCVAPTHLLLPCPGPVCAWIYIRPLRPLQQALIPSFSGDAQSHHWVPIVHFGWIRLLIGGWMLLSGLFALAEIMPVCSHDKTEQGSI